MTKTETTEATETMVAAETPFLADVDFSEVVSMSQVGVVKDGSNVTFPQQLRSRKPYLGAVQDGRWTRRGGRP